MFTTILYSVALNNIISLFYNTYGFLHDLRCAKYDSQHVSAPNTVTDNKNVPYPT